MNLKQLIKEVEKRQIEPDALDRFWLMGTKQTVEAVDEYIFYMGMSSEEREDWQTLKKLLGVK